MSLAPREAVKGGRGYFVSSWTADVTARAMVATATAIVAQAAAQAADFARLAGGGEAELETVLGALGFRAKRDSSGLSFVRRGARGTGGRGSRKAAAKRTGASDSPFAKLRDLTSGK